MQNVLLLIDNDIAAVREFERLADLMLRTSDLRPVMFIQENMYFRMHVGVPAFCAERGIEVLTAAALSAGDGAAALGTARLGVPPLACSICHRNRADAGAAGGVSPPPSSPGGGDRQSDHPGACAT